MEYEVRRLNRVPDLKNCVGVRIGDTEEHALERLAWAIGADDIKLEKNKDIVCYVYRSVTGGYEAALVAFSKENQKSLFILGEKDSTGRRL